MSFTLAVYAANIGEVRNKTLVGKLAGKMPPARPRYK